MSFDYSGDMSYYQRQLTAKGIPVEELDMNDYAGLTPSELQSIVNHAEQYRHKPKQSALVVFQTYQNALAEFQPVLTRFGFCTTFTQQDFEEQIPNWFNLKDTYTGQIVPIGFQASYGDTIDAQDNFLRDLKRFLNTCCSDEHKMQYKKTSNNNTFWYCNKKDACLYCRQRVTPAVYNRLKAVFYELYYIIQERKTA